MMPVVSVLLPCFDAAATLEEALESLWRQSFTDFEVIAVNDGSSDATGEILARAARDPGADVRLQVLETAHQGIASALRAARLEARGQLIARMDADDRAHPDRFRLQVDHLHQNPDLSVSCSRVRLFPRDALKDGYLRYEAWINALLTHDDIRRNLFVESPIPHPTVMMRRDALDAAGGYRANGWPEDYDLWMRLAFSGHRFEKLDDVLVDWREAPTRASRIDPIFSAERFMDVKEHYLRDHVLDPSRPLAVWGAGPVGKLWGRRLWPRYFIEVDPRKVGQTIGGASVIASDELTRVEGFFVIVAVASLSRTRDENAPWRAARDEIRNELTAAGFEENRDSMCVA
ncbi:MAG: glycosyltransferase [Acidobacteriota bacterium]|nr:MAG: glycosyltransferase [Acidobacteriota bacterium]